MPRAKAKPKAEPKIYPPGYFDFDADAGTRTTEEIITILFCPEDGTLKDSPELKAIARKAFSALDDKPKSLRVIAEETDLLGQQLPLMFVLRGMTEKGTAIGNLEDGWSQGSLVKGVSAIEKKVS